MTKAGDRLIAAENEAPGIVEILPRLQRIAARVLQIPEDRVRPESNLIADLGGDSLDVVEFVIDVEAEFDIEIDDAKLDEVETIADVVKLVEGAKR
jgi:acyl carrier protein